MKKKTEAEWDLYRTFLAVVRDGSFSAAARNLRVAQPTVSRHIELLESALGASLFKRSRRGLAPSPTARDVLPLAEAMATAAAAVQRACSAETQDERGAVRIGASELVSCEILPAILAEFCLAYSHIELELTASSRNEDLLGRSVDIAVRMVRPTQHALIARRVGTVEIGLFAHSRYIARFGIPPSSADLARHRMIGFDQDAHAIRSAGGRAAELRREDFGFRCDNAHVQLATLRNGAGIGGHHVHLARREPELVRVLEQAFKFKREMWLVMHRQSRSTRRIRLVFDHLASSLTAQLNQHGTSRQSVRQ
jgi:DNA-binding transcriptional LysR family regulator